MYREVFAPVDNSRESDWAVDRAIELCARFGGRITGSHVYAARLHDIRFRQLEIGLPAQFQEPAEIRRQRKIHDKLIEKGLQLISDSFLDQLHRRCTEAGVTITRQLLEGINYEEIINEANRGGGRLPSLIGFDPNIAHNYDGSEKQRTDVRLGENGRLVAEDEEQEDKLAGTSGRDYDLVAIGAHGLGRQERSRLGGVVARSLRGIEKDALIIRDDRPLEGGKWLVGVDGSAYAYKGLRIALEMAREYGAKVYIASAFDVQYHHVVFHNIKDVLSVQASKVFKFEEQEELHNNIIDKGLLRLCKANIKRAQVMASEYPEVEIETQVLIGKPFDALLKWADEIDPSLLVVARHGSHRIEGTDLGSQADNLVHLSDTNVLLIGTENVRPEEIPWIEEDGEAGLEWAPEAEVRILRVPPFALGIARKAVEEFVLEHYGPGSRYAAAFVPNPKDEKQYRAAPPPDGDAAAGNGASGTAKVARDALETGAAPSIAEVGQAANGRGNAESEKAELWNRDQLPVVTNERLDEAIKKLLPTHMQLVMGIGDAEELALAEVKANEAMKRTVVETSDADAFETPLPVMAKCPVTDNQIPRDRTAADPIVWTHEAFDRLGRVPLIARPLARNTVERFARDQGMWRVTTVVMDENKDAMIAADEFDLDTMLVMFNELKAKQARAEAAGVDGMSEEMKRFIEEAKASGVTRCPIRDIEQQAEDCPVDFKMVSPDDARAAVEKFARTELGDESGADVGPASEQGSREK
ncbi:universal stress protein [Candidatus Palauibacter soopunensis]|uniref:universal stress protein n=1 Tax=Candidatus Palauibacter soopunensis TaxID=3056739 RepID=UPI00238FDCED|nr:universal stress protein [Candidatus Palauibacter soopunensis]MDE2879196.1 universal stress protein [Candidatus Palauibacter soopunensis]